jgi:hypothetical protein
VRRRVEAPLDVFVVVVSARRPVTTHARESADRRLDTSLLDCTTSRGCTSASRHDRTCVIAAKSDHRGRSVPVMGLRPR